MARRLPKIASELIARDQPLSFTFEGTQYSGFSGDTVTSALLANGVLTLGRSFKYHRPRSTLSFANHDINVLLETDERTNIRGDIEALEANASYRAINTLFGLKRDGLQLIGKLSRFLPVGFYYKAFYKPSRLFPIWEKLFRNVAGLGTVNTHAALIRLPEYKHYCDIIVVGAGATGLSATITALDAGAHVVLVDEREQPGGSLNYSSNADNTALLSRFHQEYAAHENLTLFIGSVASGFYTDNWIPVHQKHASFLVHAEKVIFATGVIEMPFVFRNNDTPGVFLISAIQRLVHRYAVCPFNEAIMVVANDDSYAALMDLIRHGVTVKALLDTRTVPIDHDIAQALMENGIQYYANAKPVQALVKSGRLNGLEFTHDEQTMQIHCDGLLMSAGWCPAAQLFYQSGGKMRYCDELKQFIPEQIPENIYIAGRVNGVFSYEDRCNDGIASAQHALQEKFAIEQTVSRPARDAKSHSADYPIYKHELGKEFIDLDEDIQIHDMEVACKEGFDNIELIKRYTTIGMGPSQGKHSNMNGIRFLAKYLNQTINATGSTTARPFYHPVPLKNLAGRRIRRQWQTPLHYHHKNNQASFVESGYWLRPAYYERPGKTKEQCIRDEYLAVRDGLGIIDVSSLGKIEVFGPDCLALLESVYTCKLSMLTPGMTRYLVMVDDTGVIVDDGVAACINENHFYITTTTGHAAATCRQLQRQQAFLNFNVEVIDMTSRYAAINLAGQHAANVLQPLIDIALDSEAFPYLAFRTTTLDGVPIKVMRVGFVGELSYELHFPISYAHFIWQKLMEAGTPCNITPFGLEAQRRLRLEKGHCIVGQDTDGLTHPYEAGLGWNVHLDKNKFIGKSALTFLKQNTNRKLMAFTTDYESDDAPIEESLLIIEEGEMQGRVTSIGYSPSLNCTIGMAMLEKNMAEVDRTVSIKLANGESVAAKLCRFPIFDPDNERQNLSARILPEDKND